MIVRRRDFVSASLVIGAGVALSPLSQLSSTGPAGSAAGYRAVGGFRILRPFELQPRLFELGLRTALRAGGIDSRQVHVSPPPEPSLRRWRDLLAMAPGTTLVGMMSDADAVLAGEIIRERGYSILYVGAHVPGTGEQIRHTLTTTVPIERREWLEAEGLQSDQLAGRGWPGGLGRMLARLVPCCRPSDRGAGSIVVCGRNDALQGRTAYATIVATA